MLSNVPYKEKTILKGTHPVYVQKPIMVEILLKFPNISLSKAQCSIPWLKKKRTTTTTTTNNSNNKLGIQGKFLSLIKLIYKKVTDGITINEGRVAAFPLNQKPNKDIYSCHLFTILY